MLSQKNIPAILQTMMMWKQESVECCQNDCTKMPQTVCKECNEYVCEDHLYRHPNCEEGK